MRVARGMSLVEVMVALAVLALLLQAAAPSWQAFLRTQELRVASSLWLASMERARSLALKRCSPVSILPLARNDWTSGWALVEDDNANQRIDEGETRLQSYPGIAPGLAQDFHFAGRRLQFQPDGRPLQPGHILLQTGSRRRKIILSMLGRARSCDPDAPGSGSC